jgi:hypothetical protein
VGKIGNFGPKNPCWAQKYRVGSGKLSQSDGLSDTILVQCPRFFGPKKAKRTAEASDEPEPALADQHARQLFYRGDTY